MGLETSDDAAVYQITEEIAMIQTVDFFTPVVDDPYTFGQIAAANSLSDVYAMGGEPKIALNIAAFPNCLDIEILGEILRGGAEKVKEAGAVLVGGHTIQDNEPKYGLCVSGFVHPKKVWKNYGCRLGDVLILTKPIGSGVVNTAVKAQMASEEAAKDVYKRQGYCSPRRPLGSDASLTTRNGYLRLIGRESLNSLHRVTLAAKRQTALCMDCLLYTSQRQCVCRFILRG